MPWEKGNTIWKKSLKGREERRERLNEFFEVVAGGAIEEYGNKMDKLSRKENLTKEELEFMDRFEKLFEYVRPKLSRKEVTGKDGGKIEISVEKKEEITKALDEL